MMRNELEERTGKLENWQWELAHAVYQNHPIINDVGGKDQIADIVKQGFDNWEFSPILRMYRELNPKPYIIRSSNSDLYSTWDVTIEGYCINEKAKPMTEVFKTIHEAYKTKYFELNEDVNYFSLDTDFTLNHVPDFFPNHARIAVFYVTGGSEGFYVHVDALSDGKNKNLILIKTLREGENGRYWAEQTANAISRIMQV